jgi:hypothetical protein
MGGPGKRSKKRSATSSAPPEGLTFFVDASLGGKLVPDALRGAGVRVETHDDHFPQGTPDDVWLRAAGARGWVVLTRDDRIRYRPRERAALIEAGVRAFVLVGKNQRGAETAALLVKALPALGRYLAGHPGPFVAGIGRAGRVYPLEGGR